MDEKLNEFLMELRNLLDKYGYILGVDIEGDLYGIISSPFVVIGSRGIRTIVNNQEYLSKNDIDNFLSDE